jgi:hypothetical protein
MEDNPDRFAGQREISKDEEADDPPDEGVFPEPRPQSWRSSENRLDTTRVSDWVALASDRGVTPLRRRRRVSPRARSPNTVHKEDG